MHLRSLRNQRKMLETETSKGTVCRFPRLDGVVAQLLDKITHLCLLSRRDQEHQKERKGEQQFHCTMLCNQCAIPIAARKRCSLYRNRYLSVSTLTARAGC